MPQYFNFLEAVAERRADPASAASDWHWLLGSCPFSQASCCPGHQQGRLQVVQSRDRAKPPARLQWPGPWHRALLAAQKGSSQLPGFFFFLIWCIWAAGLCKLHGVSQALLLMQHPKQLLLPASFCWKLQGLICVVSFPSCFLSLHSEGCLS